MGEYKCVTHLMKLSDFNCFIEPMKYEFYNLDIFEDWDIIKNKYMNTNYYSLIGVIFTNPYTDQYVLETNGTCIDVNMLENTFKIEGATLLDAQFHPYVLVKLSNDKFGYIDTKNFVLTEFENQEQIKDKLLEFLLSNNSP